MLDFQSDESEKCDGGDFLDSKLDLVDRVTYPNPCEFDYSSWQAFFRYERL